MATKLGVINEALGLISERELAAAELSGGTEESARVMASAWPDAVDYCLSLAAWRFASRLTQLAADGAIDGTEELYAAPGFTRAYPAPSDHLRTNWVRDTPEPLSMPVTFHYQDGYWHTNTAALFINYVSHAYRAPETWPPMFAKVVAGYLAWNKGPRIRPAADTNELRIAFEMILDKAKTTDASETPFSWHAPGRLVRSRQGGGRGPQSNSWVP